MNRPRKSRQPLDAEHSPTFEEDYLDIDHWPQAWRVDSEDIALGKVMVDLFKVFLVHQLDRARSRKTLRVHRDNLRTLGGHIIRLLHEKPSLRKRGILRVLLEAIDDDGGPIVYPALTDSEQRSFDSTCRLLHRFTLLG
jgi:hypothetical protein